MRGLVREGYTAHNLAVTDEVYAAGAVYHHSIRPQKDREESRASGPRQSVGFVFVIAMREEREAYAHYPSV